MWEEMGVGQVQHDRSSAPRVCAKREREREPRGQSVELNWFIHGIVLTLEGGRDTGSNEKFSMRRA